MNPFTVYDRAGSSMRRAPFVWLAATLLLILVMNGTLRAILEGEKQSKTAWAIVAAVASVYSVVVWALWPRLMARSKKPLPPDRLASMQWVLALVPYLVGFTAVVVGGRRWGYSAGFIVSVVLLVLTARGLRKSAK